MFLENQLVIDIDEVEKQKFLDEIPTPIPLPIKHNNRGKDILEDQGNIGNDTVEGIDPTIEQEPLEPLMELPLRRSRRER